MLLILIIFILIFQKLLILILIVLENIMNETIDDSDYMTINNNYTYFNVYKANNKKY